MHLQRGLYAIAEHFVLFTVSWPLLCADACMPRRHGIVPTTSSASPIQIATVSGRRHPRSNVTRRIRLSTVDDREYPVAQTLAVFL